MKFPSNTGAPVFFRTYSRTFDKDRESFQDTVDRTQTGLAKLGKFAPEEASLTRKMHEALKVFPSGRWLWVGGTPWAEKHGNEEGVYNCSNILIESWEDFCLTLRLLSVGNGNGYVVESNIEKLPPIVTKLNYTEVGEFGEVVPPFENTHLSYEDNTAEITIGDSSHGWAQALYNILFLASSPTETGELNLRVVFSHVRKKGAKIKGFGGVANPDDLKPYIADVIKFLNKRVGGKLTPKDATWLQCRSGKVIVAGNVRRSSEITQGDKDDKEFAEAKRNMWMQDSKGNWIVDPEKDAFRMANFTRVYHKYPTYEECLESAKSQYQFGEGAFQFAPEAIVRANADIILTSHQKNAFISTYCDYGKDAGKETLRYFYEKQYGEEIGEEELEHRINRYGLNPCFAAGTKVLTREGHFPIESLVGETVEVWDGNDWVEIDNFRVTGENQPIYLLTLNSGITVEATPYHTFILADGTRRQLRDLKIGDCLMAHDLRVHGIVQTDGAYLKGFLTGDGTSSENNRVLLNLYAPKFVCEDRLKESFRELKLPVLAGSRGSTGSTPVIEFVGDAKRKGAHGIGAASDDLLPWVREYRKDFPMEVLNWDYHSKCEFIAGCMDADGTASDTTNGFMYQIISINEAWLKGFQILLKTIGVKSHFSNMKAGGFKDFGHNGGLCPVQPSFRLTVSQSASIALSNQVVFSRLRSFGQRKCTYKIKERSYVVKSVEFSHVADKVYCCTVPGSHAVALSNGLVTGQCGEIIGTNFMCNLAEVHLNMLDPGNVDEQDEAFRAAALSVAALLHHKFKHPKLQYSRELDPIVGVSFTGLFDFFVNMFGVNWLRWWEAGRDEDWNIGDKEDGVPDGKQYKIAERYFLSRWRNVVRVTIEDYCNRHNLKMPNRYTALQPAGCLTKEALRVFDNGLLYADEHMTIAQGDVNLEYFNLSVRDGVRTKAGIANDAMPLVKVTFSNGRTLTMTPNHRLSIEGEWIYADEMIPGMQVDFELGTYTNRREARLNVNTNEYSNGCTVPDCTSPALGYFLGFLYGNGCLSENKYRLRFSHGNLSILERLSDIGHILFGIKGTISGDNSRHELCFANRQLYEWVIENGLGKYEKSKNLDRIPHAIRTASLDTILAFFAGLIDSDGCIRKEGSLSIDSSSEVFLRNLQQIGEAVGLCFSVFANTKGENFQGEKSMFGLCLSRMLSTEYALSVINEYSFKAQSRPILKATRRFKFTPYEIESVEWVKPDYTYDYGVSGIDDDDSWYWQGAIKSHNTKSLLTGASAGWHPPKAQRYIRRITFSAHHSVALACMDYGYSVVPSQSCKDDDGKLLDDPFDPRVNEWLVEIPVEVPWANLPGADEIAIEKFSLRAQWDFYMQVQTNYTLHNTSATLELYEHEVEDLAELLHKACINHEGYVSAAVLARFDAPFPRLPFEKIDKETYIRLSAEVLDRRKTDDFLAALKEHEFDSFEEAGPAPCDGDICSLSTSK